MLSVPYLGLSSPRAGILYQHISALILSLPTMLNGCALCGSQICYKRMFLLLLSLAVFQLVPVPYQGYLRISFYCLQTSGLVCTVYFFFDIYLLLLLLLYYYYYHYYHHHHHHHYHYYNK